MNDDIVTRLEDAANALDEVYPGDGGVYDLREAANTIKQLQDEIAELEELYQKLESENNHRGREIERLLAQVEEMQRLNLSRFMSCIVSGTIDKDRVTHEKWYHWSCSLCGATGIGENKDYELVHNIDCPLRVKERVI